MPAFEHAHDGLGLPALAVLFSIESSLHQPAVSTFGRLLCRASVVWRDDGDDIQYVAAVVVIRFGIITRIREQCPDRNDVPGLPHRNLELMSVGRRSSCQMNRQDQMSRHVADNPQLGISPVGRGLPEIFDSRAPLHEEAAAMVRLLTCGIDRRHFDTFATGRMQANRARQQLFHDGNLEQPGGPLLQCRKVRSLLQADRIPQVR